MAEEMRNDNIIEMETKVEAPIANTAEGFKKGFIAGAATVVSIEAIVVVCKKLHRIWQVRKVMDEEVFDDDFDDVEEVKTNEEEQQKK